MELEMKLVERIIFEIPLTNEILFLTFVKTF